MRKQVNQILNEGGRSVNLFLLEGWVCDDGKYTLRKGEAADQNSIDGPRSVKKGL